MTKTSWKIALFGLLASLLVPGWAQAQVTIEYIAHACFLVQSPAGIRVVIDPYNSHRWLGYSFPAAPAADAVLITHPHYDHDAGYYWGAEVPTIRAPGRYAIGDVRVEGIRGKHADPYGTDFGQVNTIWMLEVGGLRIAHLGDNGSLSQADIRALGRVDVLMIPIDGQYHILSRDAIEAIRSALRPRVTIPMHYRIPSLSDLPESLGPIEPWLGERRNITRLETNRTVLAPETLPRTEHIMVFPPSPAVQPWSASLRQAWAEAREARELLQEDSPGARRAAVEHLRRATALAPEAIFFWWELGKALNQAGQQEEAIRVLERGLAGAGRSDWEHRMKARALLADLYRAAGNVQLATKQYRLILAGSYRTELRRQAEDFLPVDESLTLYTNATWWDGEQSYAGPMYVRNGIFVAGEDQRPGTTIDLNGAVVTAPFAEGHNHNLMEKLFDDANEAYLEQGVFYIKAPIIYPPAINSVRPRLERPDTVDAIFSMGGLTSPGGHPVSLFVNVLSGTVYEKLAYEDFAGMAFHEISSLEQIDPALDVIESQGADFVKLFMLYAEDYERPGFVDGRGLNPIFVPSIVESAHKRGLPVTAHVQSAYDFAVAVAAGVDEIAHLPGYSWRESREQYRHRITDAEAAAAAAAGVAVVTSTSFPQSFGRSKDRQAIIRETQIANLRKLISAGVELRVGSDIYDRTGEGEGRYATRSEALNLVELGVLNTEEVLAIWIATGRAIFPQRKLGCFDPGCEASFLVFDQDPREDITELFRIRNAVKQGIEVGRKAQDQD